MADVTEVLRKVVEMYCHTNRPCYVKRFADCQRIDPFHTTTAARAGPGVANTGNVGRQVSQCLTGQFIAK